jgi:hypothetical protein
VGRERVIRWLIEDNRLEFYSFLLGLFLFVVLFAAAGS